MKPLKFLYSLLKEYFLRIAIKMRNINFALKTVLNVKNWKDYFIDIYGEPKEKTIYCCNGKKYITRSKTKDRDIFAEIVLGNEYFTDEFVLSKNSIVFDIGAQIGVFSVFVSDKAGKVFSFEPVPENFKLLKENIKLNRLQNVFAFNLAVSDKKSKQKIFLSKNNTGGHSVFGKGDFIEAQTTTLQEITEKNAPEKIDLMKMDIEGAEYSIIFGLSEKTIQKIERIVMECHDLPGFNRNPAKMISFLKKKGFKVKAKTSLFNFTTLFAEKIK